ncbi:response regulator transcription factor [Lactiplantibacillus fabifermentans]|uniref:Chemotaxis protein CheY n=2 Tax=Lactiplantibacillus fabifermentans TaxID=483011 RepID=A0A0R2NBL2_9LACO|nr:response regulator transcription factor [Lactiplantibacillus fabifermentans]ETY73197.1 chemotaxis protein CheY [Lactiplantibacillus fabifermentans T30PCM01]KRO23237.1 chemotaxis protein CheY [Lactiplantibacillus fabifermentans DSM 21115]
MAAQVMLVDDHQLIRAGIHAIIETTADFEVCAEADDGTDALAQLTTLTPDLILLDVRMQPMDGITFMEHLAEQKSTIPVVVLTTFDDQEPIQRALALGAKGYLLKDATRETIISTLKSALNGQVSIEDSIAQKAFQPQPVAPQVTPLNYEKKAILTAVANGEHSNRIATNLGVSERTVKSRLTEIYNDFGVFTRAEAVAYALKHHLIDI